MKKIISLLLVAVMLVMAFALTACNEPEPDPTPDNDETEGTTSTKLGFGIYSSIDAANATEDKKGYANAAHTAAVVLVDANGVIVACDLDTIDMTVEFTTQGVVEAPQEFKTKYELGDDYNMVLYGGAGLEWYAQADAFCNVVKGKTIDQVKALVAEEGKGTAEVITAGCTIAITDFVYAIEKACKSMVDVAITEEATVSLGIVSAYDGKNATEDADGTITLENTFVAIAKNAEGKVVSSATDAVSTEFKFDIAGTSKTDLTAQVITKKDLGTDYHMSAYGTDLNGDGVVKEWNEQAAEFDKALIGLDKAGVIALALETGYGNSALQTAGCTINIADMVKAAEKAF